MLVVLRRRACLLRPLSSSTTKPAVLVAPSSSSSSSSLMDIFSYIQSASSSSSPDKRLMFAKLLGNCNEFKEGDLAIGVAAESDAHRAFARGLLARTTIRDIDANPYLSDSLHLLTRQCIDLQASKITADWTLGELKAFLLQQKTETRMIHAVLPGLSSDVIGCVVKLMTNAELVLLGSRIFHPISSSSSMLGAKGYFGARVQPNSPTDDPEDVFWQVLNAFSFAVGDVMLGTNPVSSAPDSVLKLELALRDIVHTFGLQDSLPHCVLAHIDVQAEVERLHPGSTALWFQSIAGSDAANQTFGLTVELMLEHAKARGGQRFGLYVETGQGADFTNGHSLGVDMLMHDARKYGFARALKHAIAAANNNTTTTTINGTTVAEIYINDVAGFIGPECFRTKEQLVRVCLEDIALGKLHGLTVGLDVCATLHMDVSVEDLDWCLDQILPANPSWAMALPTKNDPMLSYLTTSFQDHVRLRHKFNYRVDDTMWRFFARELGVVEEHTGQPTKRFGDPAWVYLQYVRRKETAGSSRRRSDEDILQEAAARIRAVQAKGVPIALGHGDKPWDLNADLARQVRALCADAKTTLWHELSSEGLPSSSTRHDAVALATQSANRQDFVFHPATGETLSPESVLVVQRIAREALWRDKSHRRHHQHQPKPLMPVAVVISDGLCADAITDQAHLQPFLAALEQALAEDTNNNTRLLPNYFVVRNGRVRVGYQVGELLFGSSGDGCVVHVIGERPGNGHHTFSAYLTAVKDWGRERRVDHDSTRVVSSIADTAYDPATAARECAAIIIKAAAAASST